MNTANKDINDFIKKAQKKSSSLVHITDKSKLSTQERFKLSLCKLFVHFMNEKKLTATELSKMTKIPNSRISEISNYKIKLVTIDQLLKYLTILGEHSPKIREHLSLLEQALELPVLKVSTAKKFAKSLKSINSEASSISLKCG